MWGPETSRSSVRLEYDWGTTAASEAVIEAIARLEDTDPVELVRTLEAPLFEYVDPDALDSLITDDTPISVSFVVEDYHVYIAENELVIRYE